MASKEDLERTPLDYDLTCWYLNARRVMELVGINSIASDIYQIASIGEIGDPVRTMAVLALLKDSLTQWLRQTNPPTLGQLLATKTLRPNIFFTHYSNYFFKGLSKAREAMRRAKSNVPAIAYSKLDEFRPGRRVSFEFHPEHLTSASASSQLSGQRRLLILGAATRITDEVIEAIPWVIADPLPNVLDRIPIGLDWANRLEVFVDVIENFERVQSIPRSPRKEDLEALRIIPEDAIKQAFAEIIGEQTVPRDWGGERSDLFTSWARLQGRRISTAFAFKGRAKFHPMTLADLGKNGDQIDRLFSEPADLLVLQHCHEITPPVRSMMRAYAQRMGHPRQFCLINGYDTLRILQAYGKCGVPGAEKLG